MVQLRVKGMVAATPVLVLVLLLVTTELVTMTAAGSICMKRSEHFEDLCLNRNNCARVCQTEGFPDGACRVDGFTRRCFCKKPC